MPSGLNALAGGATVDEHRGKRVYGKGRHRAPIHPAHSYTAFRCWGPKGVALAVRGRFPFGRRLWALPVLVALSRPPEKGRRHKTPPELLRQLLRVLLRWSPGRQFVGAAGNVIAGGPLPGVFLNGARGTIIAGNDIGTDATGTALLGLVADGILLTAGASGNTVGGTGAASGNVIGGNIFGIEMNTAGTTNNLVEGNAIAFNRGAGVAVAGAGGISIRGNAALGIDDGLLNYPVLTAAVSSDNGTTVTGTVVGDPLTTLVLDFYTDSVCDPTGYGQAGAYLGTIDVATDADGNGAFTATFADAVPVGYFVTATTTDSSNSTSDFAYCQEVVAGDGRQGLSALSLSLPVQRVRMEGAQGGVIRPPFAGRGEAWLNADQPVRRAVTNDGSKAPTSRRVRWAEQIDAFWGDPVAGDLLGLSE